jgi:hypothetical protein
MRARDLKRVSPVLAGLIVGIALGALLITPALAHPSRAASISSVTIVKHKVTVPPHGSMFLSVACPSGSRTLGGGIDAVQPNGGHSTLQTMVESYPTKTTWEGLVRSDATDSRKATVYAICGKTA